MTMPQKTHLYEEHIKLKAKMLPFAGWDMPIQYTSVKEEVEAVRKKSGIFDVSHMCEFLITGSDALDFVDYLVTNDIKAPLVGKAIYAALCNPQGYVLDDLIVYKMAENEIFICANASNYKKVLNWIQKQKASYKCELKDLTSELSLIALQGPDSEGILSQILNASIQMDYYSIQKISYLNTDLIIARTGYTGEDGFEVFLPHKLVVSFWQKLISLGALPCGLAARDVLRIEVCYPLYGHELNETLTPIESGIGWAVKKEKINFIGKNAILNSSPRVKLVKLILEKGIPRENYPLCNASGLKIGHITSGTMSVILNRGIALGLIELKYYPQNEEIFVDIRGKLYPAKITKSSFVRGGHK